MSKLLNRKLEMTNHSTVAKLEGHVSQVLNAIIKSCLGIRCLHLYNLYSRNIGSRYTCLKIAY